MKLLVMTIALGAVGCGSDDTSATSDAGANDDAAVDAGDGSCVPAPSGSRARWRAENNVVDSVSDFNGSVIGTNLQYTPSRSGTAFQFSGAEAVKVNDQEMLWPTASFTLEAWTKSTFTGTGIFVLKYACSDVCTAPNDKAYYALYMTSGAPAFDIRTNADPDILKLKDTSFVVNDNTWHHIVGVRDNAAGKLLLYADGALRTEMALTALQLGPMSDLDASADAVVMGAATMQGTTSLDTYFTGAVDDVAYYDRALTAAEISAIYAAPEGICR